MPLRTYLPTLRVLLRQICLYLVRYNAQIKANFPDEDEALIDDLSDVCATIVAILDAEIAPGV